ncbi:hypothetical protein [Marinococcus halophilus]|uniref:hypothetical protein n=1 Tax=Marinococcus halophilus TaxID=1371 RepID=UPI0009A8D0BC|nr:hypothetical protein [Marinococcus halophilus]
MYALLISALNLVFITGGALYFKYIFSKKLKEHESKLKINYDNQEELIKNKRDVYIKIMKYMVVMVGNRVSEENRVEYQNNFLESYDEVWLWGDEEVIKDLSNFLRINIELNNGAINQKNRQRLSDELKDAYAQTVLSMRGSLGLSISNLDYEDYKFVYF